MRGRWYNLGKADNSTDPGSSSHAALLMRTGGNTRPTNHRSLEDDRAKTNRKRALLMPHSKLLKGNCGASNKYRNSKPNSTTNRVKIGSTMQKGETSKRNETCFPGRSLPDELMLLITSRWTGPPQRHIPENETVRAAPCERDVVYRKLSTRDWLSRTQFLTSKGGEYQTGKRPRGLNKLPCRTLTYTELTWNGENNLKMALFPITVSYQQGGLLEVRSGGTLQTRRPIRSLRCW